jgi:hypothetical protein
VDEGGFFRQFGGHLVLGAAQDERRNAAVERELGVGGTVALDGLADECVEGFSSARKPGIRKRIRLQSSPRWFSIGVPDRQRRWAALSLQALMAVRAFGFLMYCASSSTSVCQWCLASSSKSRTSSG